MFSAAAVVAAAALAGAAYAQPPAPTTTTAPAVTPTRPAPRPQPRPSLKRVAVPLELLLVDDGDTLDIRWSETDVETVRILGIDTPETRHLPHDIPYTQSFGPEARAFARGVFAATEKLELLRASTLDPFGRTLGYLFVDGRNYSVLVVRERLAAESVSYFGDNGFPAEAAEVLAAAKAAGPSAFEPPWTYRARMRELSKALKARGEYPED